MFLLLHQFEFLQQSHTLSQPLCVSDPRFKGLVSVMRPNLEVKKKSPLIEAGEL